MSTLHVKGPVTKSRRKDDLKAIALALGLSDVGIIPELVERINSYLASNPELAADPRFQGLFSYRNAALETSRKKENPKTSADKEAEDLFEQQKQVSTATGYYLEFKIFELFVFMSMCLVQTRH
jgi:hypothetical protein